MLECWRVYEGLYNCGVRFYAGVPDSLLKDFCAYVSHRAAPGCHVITANEGCAIALVSGSYLATGTLGLVYMQNSGLGNAVNPLISLADPEVYGIPMLLLMGWRGEPGIKDEPQHRKQGQITLALLEAMATPYSVLPLEADGALHVITAAVAQAKKRSAPFALVARKGTFLPYASVDDGGRQYPLTREDAIKVLVDQMDERAVVVSTTGKTSRELYEYRRFLGQDSSRDFLTVGSMGHASQIALGVALTKPDREVYCFDGDGALIMHMGSLATIGSRHPKNLKHIVINNAAHDSVGGQPTVGYEIDIPAIARACGYASAMCATTRAELSESLLKTAPMTGPLLLEIRTTRGARADLGRPSTSPLQNRDAFVRNLLTT